MGIAYDAIPVTCNATGDATVYSTKPMDGELLLIRVIRGTLASGAADITITDEQSGAAILTLTNITADGDYPVRLGAVGTTGTAITNSFVPVPVTGRIKVVVAQGGSGGAGTIHYWIKR